MNATMVNPIPPDPTIRRGNPAPELDEMLEARPLVEPDFINVPAANPDTSFRWIEFKARDGFRFHQALAQGWLVATRTDVKPGYLSPYTREGGSKFINGDLILMKISRQRYLGALKYRHQISAAMSDPSVLKAISVKQGEASIANDVMRAGPDSRGMAKLGVFAPGAADLNSTVGDAVLKTAGKMGGPVDMGKAADIKK